MTAASDVRDVLASITNAPFRITEPGPNRLLLRQNSVWFVANLDLAYLDRTAHLDRAWKDKQGAIWLETSKVADMIALVEREYGEKGIHIMPDAEHGVAPSGKIPDEVGKFPKVVDMLKACEGKVAEVSKKGGVHLEVLYDGGAGVTTFRIAARIDSPSMGEEALRHQIVDTAKVLKEAYDEVSRIVWP